MGQNQFDFIDYEDFCKQVAAAVGQDEINGIINICSGKPEKLADRVERFIKENGCDKYYQYNKGLLFDEQQEQILAEMNELEKKF